MARESCRSSAILAAALPTNRIVPTDLERCRKGEQGRRLIFGVTEADLELKGGFVHVKGVPGIQQIARRARRRERSAFQGFTMARVAGGEMFPPQRIVCLTEETVETLYLLGEQDRIVGVSGHCVRPPDARPTNRGSRLLRRPTSRRSQGNPLLSRLFSMYPPSRARSSRNARRSPTGCAPESQVRT